MKSFGKQRKIAAPPVKADDNTAVTQESAEVARIAGNLASEAVKALSKAGYSEAATGDAPKTLALKTIASSFVKSIQESQIQDSGEGNVDLVSAGLGRIIESSEEVVNSDAVENAVGQVTESVVSNIGSLEGVDIGKVAGQVAKAGTEATTKLKKVPPEVKIRSVAAVSKNTVASLDEAGLTKEQLKAGLEEVVQGSSEAISTAEAKDLDAGSLVEALAAAAGASTQGLAEFEGLAEKEIIEANLIETVTSKTLESVSKVGQEQLSDSDRVKALSAVSSTVVKEVDSVIQSEEGRKGAVGKVVSEVSKKVTKVGLSENSSILETAIKQVASETAGALNEVGLQDAISEVIEDSTATIIDTITLDTDLVSYESVASSTAAGTVKGSLNSKRALGQRPSISFTKIQPN